MTSNFNKNMGWSASNIHVGMMGMFIEKYCSKQPKVEKLYYKRPVPGADFMYNRVVIVADDLVYKIHPVEYTEKQRELIKNLNLFFENYSQSLDITEYYKEDLCWTTWTRIPGELLGKGHLEDDIWEKYLDYIVHVWKLHHNISKKLKAPKGRMWWHYDVTPWNVIVQPDNSFFLVDWDDFRLMSIEEAKQWTIDQNIEFAEMNDQDKNFLYSKLQDLQW